MNWKNASIDHPPPDGEIVLIAVHGVYYLARYDAVLQAFRLKEKPSEVFNPRETLIYWTEYNFGY